MNFGLYLGSRGSCQSRMLRVTERYKLQALAVYLFITANHETTTQVASTDKFLEVKIKGAIGEMHKLTPGHSATEILGFKNVCQTIARYLITPKITKNKLWIRTICLEQSLLIYETHIFR